MNILAIPRCKNNLKTLNKRTAVIIIHRHHVSIFPYIQALCDRNMLAFLDRSSETEEKLALRIQRTQIEPTDQSDVFHLILRIGLVESPIAVMIK